MKVKVVASNVRRINFHKSNIEERYNRRRIRRPSLSRKSSGSKASYRTGLYRAQSLSNVKSMHRENNHHLEKRLKCRKSNHYAKTCFAKPSMSFKYSSALSQKTKDENYEYYINVMIESENMKLQIDTGSDLTLLNK